MPEYHTERMRRVDERIKQLKNRRDALAAEYDLRYPPNEDIILPTRLGNILRAAESYPQLRYRIDSVPLWPRMVYAIDEKYMAHVDTANDQCSFLLNSSLLSGIFACFSFMAVIYQLFLLYILFYGIFDLSNFSVIAEPMSFITNILLYLALGLLSLMIAWFFYTASLFNVSKYGNMIRSSYDLFRFNLIEKLHLKLPPTFEKEKELWEQISEFVTIGELYGTHYFDYPSHGPDEETELELMLLADDNP